MNGMMDRFDWIAPHYDRFTRLIFGTAVYDSQVWSLGHIPDESAVLVLGGGSGRFLAELRRANPSCTVWYVEASSEMLASAIASLEAGDRSHVHFIHGTENAIPADVRFDVVITHFLLDLFPNDEVLRMCRTASDKLRVNGLWLVSDFIDGKKWWQQMMIWLMYRFFGLTCGVKATRLPDWQRHLLAVGMAEQEYRAFYGGFIRSCVYAKQRPVEAADSLVLSFQPVILRN